MSEIDVFRKLALEAIVVRNAHEWHPFTTQNLGTKLSSFFSEVVELEEAIELGDELEIRLELADVMLYAISGLEDLCPGTWTLRGAHSPKVLKWSLHRLPETLTKPLRKQIKICHEYWRKGAFRDAEIALELIVKCVVELSQLLHVDLAAAVSEKIEINRHRSKRHGMKNPDS